MSVFQKFVEWGTDAKYVPGGKKCDICGNKLGVFETGFWSINAKQLADGVLCKDCYEKLELLTRFRTACIPAKQRKEVPFCMLTATRLPQMEVQQAKQALEIRFIRQPIGPVVLMVTISTKATTKEITKDAMGPSKKPPMVMTTSFGS